MSLILKICYLCGEVLEGKLNDDHTIPKQFIQGQPKKKGFDYGGVLKVHEVCNDFFGGGKGKSEIYCKKALKILNLIFDEDKVIVRERKDNPDIKIMAFVDNDLSDFSDNDFKFFGLINAAQVPYNQLSNSKFYKDKKKTDPFRKPMNVSLTVIAKSSAALLFKRCNYYPNGKWSIYALTFLGDRNIDYDNILGETKPFDIGVKVWIKEFDNDDKFCAYKLDQLHVYFIFTKEDDLSNILELRRILPEFDIFQFSSKKLIDLVGYDWLANKF